jgi:hypothetical protein
MDDNLRKLQRGLGDSLIGTFGAARERDADLDLVHKLVSATIGRWWEAHPGIEDNTVECIACSRPTTKTNRIVSDHWGEPKYLCGRCCDGITGAPISHGEKARVVIGQ